MGRISIALPLVACIAAAPFMMGDGCDCKVDVDCPDNKLCVEGKCVSPSEGESEGGGDGVVQVGGGGADEGGATPVASTGLPMRIFGTETNGVHAGLTGFYRVTGLPGGVLDVRLADFAQSYTVCPTTSSITLTGDQTLEIFGGLDGVDCPTVTLAPDAANSLLIHWDGASPTDYGLELAAH